MCNSFLIFDKFKKMDNQYICNCLCVCLYYINTCYTQSIYIYIYIYIYFFFFFFFFFFGEILEFQLANDIIQNYFNNINIKKKQ